MAEDRFTTCNLCEAMCGLVVGVDWAKVGKWAVLLHPSTGVVGEIGDGSISIIKPAEDRDGVVIRLLLNGSSTLSLSSLLPGGVISEADLLEQDGSTEFARDFLVFDAETSGRITTLRVRP